MQLLSALSVLIKFLLSYFVYTATFTCPVNESWEESAVGFSYSPNHYTCAVLHDHLKPAILPVWTETVQPVWKEHVKPFWTFHVRPIWTDQIQPSLASFDKKYEVTSQICQTGTQVSAYFQKDVVPRLDEFKQNQVIPFLQKSLVELKYRLQISHAALTKYFQLASIYLKTQYHLHLLPVFKKIYAVEQVKPVVDWISDAYLLAKVQLTQLYTQFLQSSRTISLQKKLDFLRTEVKNVYKFDEFRKVGDAESNYRIVQAVKEFFRDQDVKVETTDFKTIHTPQEKASTHFEPTESIASTQTQSSDAPKASETQLSEDDSDSDFSDTEVITITSTITVEADLATFLPSPIDDELLYWSSKVNKTLDLAVSQIEGTIHPVVNDTIERAIGPISDKLQTLQRVNHRNYQELNRMILEINRDYERMKVSNDSTIESISRQQVRDVIARARELPVNASIVIQDLLILHHEKLVESYFRSVQDTIDVLETFSETTISEFQRKLSGILDLEQDDDIVWRTWKRFHQIKEHIFEFRDYIFNQANAYKNDSKGSTAVGLEEWNDYLRKVEFHINFLMRDNDEYLKLVRAKANIAFQAREELSRQIEKEKKENEIREQEVREQADEVVLQDVNEQVLEDLKNQDVLEVLESIQEELEEEEREIIKDSRDELEFIEEILEAINEEEFQDALKAEEAATKQDTLSEEDLELVDGEVDEVKEQEV